MTILLCPPSQAPCLDGRRSLDRVLSTGWRWRRSHPRCRRGGPAASRRARGQL